MIDLLLTTVYDFFNAFYVSADKFQDLCSCGFKGVSLGSPARSGNDGGTQWHQTASALTWIASAEALTQSMVKALTQANSKTYLNKLSQQSVVRVSKTFCTSQLQDYWNLDNNFNPMNGIRVGEAANPGPEVTSHRLDLDDSEASVNSGDEEIWFADGTNQSE